MADTETVKEKCKNCKDIDSLCAECGEICASCHENSVCGNCGEICESCRFNGCDEFVSQEQKARILTCKMDHCSAKMEGENLDLCDRCALKSWEVLVNA